MTDENKTEEAVVEDAVEETVAAPEEEKAPEAAPEAVETEEVEVPAEFKALIEQVENMTVLELHSLVKILEKKFGISAAATAVAGPAEAASAEEKSEFTVVLSSIGDSKIGVIKVVKEILGLGLKEAKDLVDGAPTDLKSDVKAEEAEEWKTKLEEAGAKVELK